MTESSSTDQDPRIAVLKQEIAGIIKAQMGRALANLGRVKRLLVLAHQLQWLMTTAPTEVGGREDVLRAAVILIHATLEDFLRTVGATYLPHATEEVLNGIALVGSKEPRAEKFYLGRLARHRGRTVDEVIPEVRAVYPRLAQLMARRHAIAHNADLVPDQTTPQAIEVQDVEDWLDAAITLVDNVSVPHISERLATRWVALSPPQ